MQKTIANSNIIILLNDLQEAIQEGYRLVPNKSFLETYPLNEITLYKEDVDVAELSEYDALPKVTVESYDAMSVLFDVQRFIVNGYEIQDSVFWLGVGTKRFPMFKPTHLANVVYTKEELDEMEYELLKEVGRVRNCFNRSRSVMVNNILKFQDEQQ